MLGLLEEGVLLAGLAARLPLVHTARFWPIRRLSLGAMLFHLANSGTPTLWRRAISQSVSPGCTV